MPVLIPPKQFQARLAEKVEFNQRFTQFTFELDHPHQLQFLAGQYISIKVSERGERRSYSIVSSPATTHAFDLLVELFPDGLGSQLLANLNFGDQIELLAPLGLFTIAPNTTEQALVLVATGSGVAPYRSMLLDLLQVKHDPRPITLYWGMRYAADLFWLDECAELAESFPNFHFHPVISRPEEAWSLCRGRVTDCLTVHDQPANAGYYLCGSAGMIREVRPLLEARGVLPDQIHHEQFYE